MRKSREHYGIERERERDRTGGKEEQREEGREGGGMKGGRKEVKAIRRLVLCEE